MDHRHKVSSSPEPVDALLRCVPFFTDLDRVDIARLIGGLERVHVPAGTVIFSEGARADALYLLERGKVNITVRTADGDRSVAVLEAPQHFGDLGLLIARRTASARAITDVDAWRLPRERLEQVVRERPAIGLAMAASLATLIDERSRERVGATRSSAIEGDAAINIPHPARSVRWRAMGVVAALALPLALWSIPPVGGLTSKGWHVGVIVLGAGAAWLCQPVPDFVVALGMAAAWGITGLVPVSMAFSGFASPTWVLALGAVGLAAAMARSGLLFRLALLLLRFVPATHAGQICALLTGGVLTTPIVPMATARIATTGGLAQELAQGLGYSGRTQESAALAFAGLIGYASFSSVFLTGLATNFFVLGLLPPAERLHIDWLTWFREAAPVGIILYVGALVILLVLFRPQRAPTVSVEMLHRQAAVLGPLSRQERTTIAALAVLLIGLLVQPLLRVDTAWLGATALVVVLAGGVLDRTMFRREIEWGFLVLFGILVGSGEVFRSAGIDQWIAARLIPLVHAVGHPALLAPLLGASVAVCRLVLPRVPANFLLSLALVPAAPHLGLAPWLVGFIVLTVGNTWLLPNLSDFYTLLRDATRGEMFTERDGVLVGAALTLLVIVAIAASVPYWRATGLIRP
ncbi:MAG TPA: SLC13 family permease [bacterium]|nr:SLC13 family permease [bacterium]